MPRDLSRRIPYDDPSDNRNGFRLHPGHGHPERDRPGDVQSPAHIRHRAQRRRQDHPDTLPQQAPVPHQGHGADRREGCVGIQGQGAGEEDRVCSIHLRRQLPDVRRGHRPDGEEPAQEMEHPARGHEDRRGGAGDDGHLRPRDAPVQRAVRRTASEGHAGPRIGAAARGAPAGRTDGQPGHQAPDGRHPPAEEAVGPQGDNGRDDQPRHQHRREVLRQHHHDEGRGDLRGRDASGCHHRGEHQGRLRSGFPTHRPRRETARDPGGPGLRRGGREDAGGLVCRLRKPSRPSTPPPWRGGTRAARRRRSSSWASAPL